MNFWTDGVNLIHDGAKFIFCADCPCVIKCPRCTPGSDKTKMRVTISNIVGTRAWVNGTYILPRLTGSGQACQWQLQVTPPGGSLIRLWAVMGANAPLGQGNQFGISLTGIFATLGSYGGDMYWWSLPTFPDLVTPVNCRLEDYPIYRQHSIFSSPNEVVTWEWA